MTVCLNYDIEMLRYLKALYKYTDRFLAIFSLVDASSRRIRKRLFFSRSYVSFVREDRAVPVLPSPNISGKFVLKGGGGLESGVSRFGLAVRLVSRGTSVRIRFGSPFSAKIVVCGHCLVTLSLTINETLKWLSSLPTLIQESFWW